MSSQPKKARFSQKQKYKKHFMEAGQRGFLATCNFKQRDCIRECYNILNQYADTLYGPAEPAPDTRAAAENNDVEEDDVIDDLLKECQAIAKQKHTDKALQRFVAVDTGVTNCIFIRTQLPDPMELCTRIVDDIATTKKALSRFLLRLLPVEVICKANIEEMIAKAGILFDKHFIKGKCTFAIVFNRRFNNDISRDLTIRELAQLVHSKNPLNSVDLKNAEKTVIVEVIKGLCCLSVVTNYIKYRKYNLVELGKPEEPTKTTNSVAAKEGEETTTEDVAGQKTSQDAVQKTSDGDDDAKDTVAVDVKPDTNVDEKLDGGAEDNGEQV